MALLLAATRRQRTATISNTTSFWFIFLSIIAQLTLVLAQTGPPWIARPFNPPALPLAVRSPYVNAWHPQGNGPSAINTNWPQMWPINNNLGWYAAVQVDGTTFRLLGGASVPAVNLSEQTAVEFTPTRTSVISTAGPVEVNLTFWSPIEPNDVVRQSFPGIHFGIGIRSTDGLTHDIRVYSDVSGEWISGNTNLVSNWTNTVTGDLVYHQQQLVSPAPFSEVADHAQDASAFFGMARRPGLTYMIGGDSTLRSLFNSSGALSNEIDTNFRPVGENFTIFSLSVALGEIVDTDESSMVVFSLAVLRDPVVRYMQPNGVIENRSPAYLSRYNFRQNAFEAFITDLPTTLPALAQLDAQLLSSASAISPEYANLISLVTRQVLGAGEITMTRNSDGSWNETDVMMFVKDMGGLGGSGGNGGVNAVDVLYASFPGYLFLNPSLGEYALRPLLLYQSSPVYPQQYAAVNLGGPYPNATGNSAEHNMGVEQSANMLIMVLAHAQASGNGALINQFYPLLKKWGDYLVANANALGTGAQATADSAVGTNMPQFNQTNLAIKGALGIGAMARISQAAGKSDDARRYQDASANMISAWIPLAVASDNSHLLANFGQSSSSALVYNLFADKLLQLKAVPDSVYEAQTAFVASAAANSRYGVPLSSFDPTISRTDWSMFTAATLTSTNTRNLLITQLQNYASPNLNNTPFAVSYDPTTGRASPGLNTGMNSAAQGAIFSLLALTQDIKPVTLPGSSGSSSSTGAIVGGVIAGVVVLGILAFLAFFLYRRRRQRRTSHYGGYADAITPAKRGDIVGGPAPTSYEPFTLGLPNQNASVSQGTATRPSMSMREHSDMEVSSPLLSGVAGDSIHTRGSNMNAGALPPGAAAATTGAGGFTLGHQANNSRGSAYFRRPGSVSDLGPSASQVGAVQNRSQNQSQSQSGIGSADATGSGTTGSFHVRNGSVSTAITQPVSVATGRFGGSGSGSLPSQGSVPKQAMVNDDLRLEVDNLRREMDRLREERFAGGGTAVIDEAPPSYFDQEDTNPVRQR